MELERNKSLVFLLAYHYSIELKVLIKWFLGFPKLQWIGIDFV